MPREVTSCAECLAWGRTHSQGVCLACYNFSAARFGHLPGQCSACRRYVPLKSGYCRLCWCQARVDRDVLAEDPRAAVLIAPYLPRIRHHQLFLAGMTKRQALPRRAPRRYGAKGRPPKPPPAPTIRPRVEPEQLRLFVDAGPRDWHCARVDLRRSPTPDNPWLRWALHLAHTAAEARGWRPEVRRGMQRALVTVLARQRAGELIPVSVVRTVTAAHSVNLSSALEILETMSVVQDDRSCGFERWLRPVLHGLAPAIGRDVRRWARHLHDGTARTAARHPQTARAYVRIARPALQEWSIRYDHLREVTRVDVVAYLELLRGEPRRSALTALRSLFRWARRTGLIFSNPTTRIRLPRQEFRLWEPLPHEAVAAAVAAATTLQARVFVVLAAVHAARHAVIRALQLSDVDLGDRRLRLDGHDRPMDELTHDVISNWLDYRQQTWPTTANPHLLISTQSALRHGPVSATWMRNLRGLTATLERIRIDRQLDEALAVGFDPLHLAEVFDIAEATAIRYASNARQLLERPHENPTAGSWPTRRS